MILDAVFQEVNHTLNADFGTVFISGGNSPDLNGCIRLWQPNTEYKVGDVCLATDYEGMSGELVNCIITCKQSHKSYTESDGGLVRDISEGKWKKDFVTASSSIYDILGNMITEHYATKDELAEAIGQALEGDY
jgi:hypothetical protein